MTMADKQAAAIKDFEEFVTGGQYRLYKQLEQRQSEARDFIQKQLRDHDGYRFEFKEFGYVGRFVRKTTTHTDHVALLDELTNYIAVPSLIQLGVLNFKPTSEDIQASVEPFLLPVDTFIRPSLNKVGKAFVTVQKGYYDNYPNLLGYKGEIRGYVEREARYKEMAKQYKQLMTKIRAVLTKSVKTPYGTLSVISKNATYDLDGILREWGEEFLLSNCQVKLTELQELMEMGFLDKKFLKPFQEIVDVRVDFILQSIENEQKSWDMLQRRKQALQQILAS